MAWFKKSELNDDVIDVRSLPCSVNEPNANKINSTSPIKDNGASGTNGNPIVFNVNVMSNNPSTFQANKNSDTSNPVDYYSSNENPVFQPVVAQPNVMQPVLVNNEHLKQVYDKIEQDRINKVVTTQPELKETEYISRYKSINDTAPVQKTKCAETFYREFV